MPDKAIKIELLSLDTECGWDKLYLFDGKSYRDKMIGEYSGLYQPREVYAYSGNVS